MTEIEQINTRFNEELQRQINGTLPLDYVYQLGWPGTILRSTGFPDEPIELTATRLLAKSLQRNHEFDISEVCNLPQALQKPLAVFAYGDSSKAQNVIAEIEKNGKKFVVGIHLNQEHRGIRINDIRGLFPKDTAEWLNWITQGKLLYVDKKRIQDLITQRRTNLAEVGYLDLDSVAKIIQNFENPKIEPVKAVKQHPAPKKNRGLKL